MKGIVDLHIKESLPELEAIRKKCSPYIRPRIKMLILLKNEPQGLTKTQVYKKLNVVYNSVVKWQNLYNEGGIEKLATFKIGRHQLNNGHAFALPKEVYDAIEQQHKKSPFRSYAAMHRWVKEHYVRNIKCTTLIKYVDQYFGNKLHISRIIELKVKESYSELEKIHDGLLPRMQPRIQMLMCLKKERSLTLLGLAKKTGAAYGSVAKWVKLYKQGGMRKLFEYNIPAVITPEVHNFIEKQLAEKSFKSFPLLHSDVNEKYIPGIKYFTLHRYVIRHFAEEVKLAKGPQLEVKESLQYLEELYKKSMPKLKMRLFMLITIKNKPGIKKSELILCDGIKQDSVYRWCKLYEQGGLDALMDIKMSGRKKFMFPANIHNALELKLRRSPAIKLTTLHKWLISTYALGVSYNKLYRYVQLHFSDVSAVVTKSRPVVNYGYPSGFAA